MTGQCRPQPFGIVNFAVYRYTETVSKPTELSPIRQRESQGEA